MKTLNQHQLTYLYQKPTVSSYSPTTLKLQQKPTLLTKLLKKPTKNPLSLPLIKPTTASLPSDILRLMDGLDIPVSIGIYTSLIRECTEAKDRIGAYEICRHIMRMLGFGFCQMGLVFINRVLLMLVSCGLVDNARQMFDEMSVRDSNTWGIMMGCYMGIGDYEEIINLFLKMEYRRELGNTDDCSLEIPFSWILVCVLKACVETNRLELGKQVHSLVMKNGYEDNLFLSSSLMSFYGNFGCLEGLDCVFDRLSKRNTAIWTNKLVNDCREKRFKEAIDVFREMGRQGVKKNEFTFSSVLRACGRVEDDDGLCGKQVHANLIKLGFDSNDFVQCGLVDMYAKCGNIKYAKRVFKAIGGERTLACWNAMLTGYIQHGYCVDAIKVVYAMKLLGFRPQESLINEVKFTCGSNFINEAMEPFTSR